MEQDLISVNVKEINWWTHGCMGNDSSVQKAICGKRICWLYRFWQ